ncbi:hypothetical protein BDY21DRAFT_143891 [Lineolata rhizophorae]|uniref:Uncharacterized protein n=1 Tax=Lineolata rhizophorae TaxID=578093 RepID=A0A6A6NNF7_9PEZI|nr:hypothetical protein BDY21DRAFT_143891 [Lineolata rhizophorae]
MTRHFFLAQRRLSLGSASAQAEPPLLKTDQGPFLEIAPISWSIYRLVNSTRPALGLCFWASDPKSSLKDHRINSMPFRGSYLRKNAILWPSAIGFSFFP